MTTVTVFRRVPPPIIGVCGVVPDRTYEAFEESLDWLETTGVVVERFDPVTQPAELRAVPEADQALARDGDRGLPLILVDDVVASSGRLPTRSELARMIGRRRPERSSPAPAPTHEQATTRSRH